MYIRVLNGKPTGSFVSQPRTGTGAGQARCHLAAAVSGGRTAVTDGGRPKQTPEPEPHIPPPRNLLKWKHNIGNWLLRRGSGENNGRQPAALAAKAVAGSSPCKLINWRRKLEIRLDKQRGDRELTRGSSPEVAAPALLCSGCSEVTAPAHRLSLASFAPVESVQVVSHSPRRLIFLWLAVVATVPAMASPSSSISPAPSRRLRPAIPFLPTRLPLSDLLFLEAVWMKTKKEEARPLPIPSNNVSDFRRDYDLKYDVSSVHQKSPRRRLLQHHRTTTTVTSYQLPFITSFEMRLHNCKTKGITWNIDNEEDSNGDKTTSSAYQVLDIMPSALPDCIDMKAAFHSKIIGLHSNELAESDYQRDIVANYQNSEASHSHMADMNWATFKQNQGWA
ncbi:hypothetical protein LXL04_009208 [Taraxacum kok-saghyz]